MCNRWATYIKIKQVRSLGGCALQEFRFFSLHNLGYKASWIVQIGKWCWTSLGLGNEGSICSMRILFLERAEVRQRMVRSYRFEFIVFGAGFGNQGSRFRVHGLGFWC